MLAISLIGFTLIYGVLMIADIYLLQKFARVDDTDQPIPWVDTPKTDPALRRQLGG